MPHPEARRSNWVFHCRSTQDNSATSSFTRVLHFSGTMPEGADELRHGACEATQA